MESYDRDTSREGNIGDESFQHLCSKDFDARIVPTKSDDIDSDIGKRNRRRSLSGLYISKRYIFSLLGFVACSLSVNFNTNMSIAIVSMVSRNASATHVRNANECLADIPSHHDSGDSTDDDDYTHGEFYWSTQIEGLVIGAAYYGQVIGFIPGGRLAELFGGKRILLGSILLSSLLTMLIPVAAHLSVYALLVCRFFIGVGTAPSIPVLFYMIAKWIPTTERNFHASFILAGYGIGSFAGFVAAGVLCSSSFLGGWPLVFYSGGIVGIVWCIFFHIFCSETPIDHPTIKSEELHYILSNLPIEDREKIRTIPWKKMAKSLPLWSLCVAYFGQFWILGFFCTAHAMYMGTILNLDIEKNGQLSCLPHLLRAVFACICSFPADYILKKKYVGVTFIRKAATTLNTAVSCAGFVGILLAGCDPISNTIFFTIGGLLGDFVTFGVCMACVDMAPRLSGTVSGILNIIGVIPFFLIPSIIGWVTRYERSMKQWSYVYYCTIAVAVVTNIVYLIFGTSAPQAWGTDVCESDKQPSESTPESQKMESDEA